MDYTLLCIYLNFLPIFNTILNQNNISPNSESSVCGPASITCISHNSLLHFLNLMHSDNKSLLNKELLRYPDPINLLTNNFPLLSDNHLTSDRYNPNSKNKIISFYHPHPAIYSNSQKSL